MSHLSHVIPSFDQRAIFSALELLGCCTEQVSFEHVVFIDECTSASFSVQKRTPFCVYVSMSVMGADPFEMDLIIYPAQKVAKVDSLIRQGETKKVFTGYDASWSLIEDVHVFLQNWLDMVLSVVGSKEAEAGLCSV